MGDGPPPVRASFKVDRWRLDELDLENEARVAQKRRNAELPFSVPLVNRLDVELYGSQLQQRLVSSSSFADNLLHLVNYNTFRGVFYNKLLLSGMVRYAIGGNLEKTPWVQVWDVMPNKAIMVVMAQTHKMPDSLKPTQLQLTIPHPVWMDFYPFPNMRDQLILHQRAFDHPVFIRDMFGDLIDEVFYPQRAESAAPPRPRLRLPANANDEVTVDRQGMILWGEPHNPDSWECTPGFLRKWGWLLVGSEEIIMSTNRWRLKRGKGPIAVESSAPGRV